jgi:hypothetical protein
MSDRGSSSGPVATLTVAERGSTSGPLPGVDEISAALHEIYPSDRFSIEHRAMAIDNETHVVFDVYEGRRTRS